MSTSTVNLALTLPENSDLALISVINTNMTTLDALMSSSAPTTIAMSDSPDVGTLSRLAYSNHRHGAPGFGTPIAVGAANSEGSASTLARSNHVHQGASYYYNHGPETFDINAGIAEDVMLYVPSVPTAATLVLRGRQLVAGLVGSHTHIATAAPESAHTHTGTAASGGSGVVTSAGGSAHGHAGSSVGAGTAHTHNLYTTTGGQSSVQLDAATGPASNAGYVLDEAAHTHTPTIATEAAHTHSVTTNNHTHTVSVTGGSAHLHVVTNDLSGSGGFTVTSRPATVTVTIDGTDRTAALGGGSGFGTSGADWNEQALNILTYVSSAGWHTISFSATTGGRLKAQVVLAL